MRAVDVAAIRIAANSATTQRVGILTIAGRTFVVTEAGICAFAVTPASVSAPPDGTTAGTFTITTTSPCTWTVAGMPPWITMTRDTRTGSGTVVYAIALNPDTERSATSTIAGKSILVNQRAAPVLRPANLRIVGGGG